MSKSFKRTKVDYSFIEDYVVDQRKQKNRIKEKRFTHALKTRNLDELIELEELDDEHDD